MYIQLIKFDSWVPYGHTIKFDARFANLILFNVNDNNNHNLATR